MPSDRKPTTAPNPGYDRPPRPAPKVKMEQEVYPKPFISGLKGQGTINANARRQMEQALKDQ